MRLRELILGVQVWIYGTLIAVNSINWANRHIHPPPPAPVPKIASCVTIGAFVLLVTIPLYRKGGQR